jgi:hypothetical protein
MRQDGTPIEIESALRALSRSQKGPWSLFAYGLRRHPKDQTDQAAMEKELAPLFPQEKATIVLDPEDPFSPALIRKGFQEQILGPLERRNGAPEVLSALREASSGDALRPPRDRLASAMAELPTLLENVDRLLLGVPSETGGTTPERSIGEGTQPGCRRPERSPLPVLERPPRSLAERVPLLFVPRFEDLGSDAEAVAEALAQVVLRKAHLVIPEGPLDTRTPEGRAGLRIVLRLGAIRARRSRERSLRDVDRRRTEMKVYGPVPYGFTKDGTKLAPVREELAVVRRILDLGALRRSSFDIASRLNDDHVAWKDGSPWTWRRVHQVLRNPLYPSILKGAIS